MDEISFFNKIGFKENPFQYTNADEEDNLREYFVPPPYFQSVWGNPSKPSSCVIFAPRGGGKSAQRKMIEERSIESDVLSIQYSRFEFQPGVSLEDVDLNYHLINIVRLCLIALLMKIYEKKLDHTSFSSYERNQINNLCKFYLNNMSDDEVMTAVKAIMSPFDKAKEFFRNKMWAINVIINAIFPKLGLVAVASPGSVVGLDINSPSKNHLENVTSIITSLGYKSIYILIDKVDETQLTGNNAKASFDLMMPLLRDLDLLQMKDIAFKFFLWDELDEYYRAYARPDRISQFRLKWEVKDLLKMLEQRLNAFSANGSPKFNDIFDVSMTNSAKDAIKDLLIIFSDRSPRDLIRILQQMVDEQLRLDPYGERIGMKAVTKGFETFCEERAKEVLPGHIQRDLQKTHRLDFTVNYIATEVFKIGTNGARAKIKTWMNTGIVKHIDDIKLKTAAKPVHHYAIVDSRVAKSIFQDINFFKFLNDKVKMCSRCKMELLRDWDLSSKQICHNCKARYN